MSEFYYHGTVNTCMYVYIYMCCSILFEQNSSAGSRLIAATVSFFKKPEESYPQKPRGASQVRMGKRIRFGWILDDNRNYKSNMLQHPHPIFVYPVHFFCNVTELPPKKHQKPRLFCIDFCHGSTGGKKEFAMDKRSCFMENKV